MKAVDQTWATSMSRTPVTQVHSGVPFRSISPRWTPTARRMSEKAAEPTNAARSTAGENSQRLTGPAPVSGTVWVLIAGSQHRLELDSAGQQDFLGGAEALEKRFLHDTDAAQVGVGEMDVAVRPGRLRP